eukprot:TRINITY_DN17101_c0_g1_i1.p1 TRINITY_DN17101_c0_g1~~TRINITY_DN17101_c0_g1_i1.p1  ORF type:complete len:238 (+),score=18.19 TRINITY_DN17101_c0_g1_i1:87-800(+)
MQRPVGILTDDEKKGGLFSSTLKMTDIRLGGKVLKIGLMGNPDIFKRGKDGEAVPCIIAISGEAQQHVSRFFQAWKVEERGWITVTPIRPNKHGLFFEDERALGMIKGLVEHLKETLNIEDNKVHLVGTSNGGTTAWHYAAHYPDDVASVTVVTGCLTRYAEANISRTFAIPTEVYVGDGDELGFYPALQHAKRVLDTAGHPNSNLHILPGAGHFNIGQFVDMKAFWEKMESMRVKE